MSLEDALRAIVREEITSALAAFRADAPKRGRPPKGEEGAPTAAAPPASPPALVASAPNTPPPGSAPPAAPPATAATDKPLTHAAVGPIFLAAAKKHGRAFVIGVMCDILKVGKDPEPTFDKVPVARLAEAKAMLEAGPQKKAAADDGSDLLG